MYDKTNIEYSEGPKLSRRLTALAEWVPEGARLADIGTDHALLPVYLAKAGKITYAVAGDVHAGPAEAARRQVAEAGLDEIISVRLGDGFHVLAPGEVDTVCIAGMGGSLIARLLIEAGNRLDGVRTLVLSPHGAEDRVRQWLRDNSFVLVNERLLEEEGIIYTLLKAVLSDGCQADAEKANEEIYDPKLLAPCVPSMSVHLQYEMGPLLLRNPDETFYFKWNEEMRKREKMVQGMRRSVSPEALSKAEQWEQETNYIREVLSCLRGERRSPS